MESFSQGRDREGKERIQFTLEGAPVCQGECIGRARSRGGSPAKQRAVAAPGWGDGACMGVAARTKRVGRSDLPTKSANSQGVWGRKRGIRPSDAMGMGTQVLPEDFALPDRSRVRMNQRSVFPLVLLISPRPSVLVGIKRILGRLNVLWDGRVWGSTVSP